MTEQPESPEVLERVAGPRGELVLRRVGTELEVISNGVFLMDTRDGRSERALVTEALRMHGSPRRLLLGGLGVGFSLREAVGHRELDTIVVTEIEPVLVEWHRTHLRDRTGQALADPRVRVALVDVREHLAGHRQEYDVVCLDVDNGPDWTVIESNDALYAAAGLAVCVAALDVGGVLAVWSAARSPDYERLLRDRLDEVRVVEIETQVARAGPDVVYLGRRRNGQRRRSR